MTVDERSHIMCGWLMTVDERSTKDNLLGERGPVSDLVTTPSKDDSVARCLETSLMAILSSNRCYSVDLQKQTAKIIPCISLYTVRDSDEVRDISECTRMTKQPLITLTVIGPK